MNKFVLIINGKAEVGKDTLCDVVIQHFKAEKISAITPILRIASENGWNGKKDKKSRKFLADLKRVFIEFNDLPNTYLLERFDEFMEGPNDILLVHIRESDQILEFTNNICDRCKCVSLLVKRSTGHKPKFYGNDADDYVDNYRYDYYYNNFLPLDESKESFLDFFDKILCEKGLYHISRREET